MSAVSLKAKQAYVGAMHGARGMLERTGGLAWLDRRTSRPGRWARSLLSIYDLDDMERIGVPWWTFDAIAAVETYLAEHPDARVFEWGSGASTLWLAARAGSVVSTEFDPDWHARLTEKLAGHGHVTVKLRPAAASGTIASAKPGFAGQYFDDFVRAIRDETGPFDVIVIDGRAREACLTEAIPRLSDTGIIVFDDTRRTRYRDAMRASGLARREFGGLAVSLPLPDSTTLLSRDRSTLDAL